MGDHEGVHNLQRYVARFLELVMGLCIFLRFIVVISIFILLSRHESLRGV